MKEKFFTCIYRNRSSLANALRSRNSLNLDAVSDPRVSKYTIGFFTVRRAIDVATIASAKIKLSIDKDTIFHQDVRAITRKMRPIRVDFPTVARNFFTIDSPSQRINHCQHLES
jgi:hypothetical protein